MGLAECEQLVAAESQPSISAEIRWKDGTEVEVVNSLTSPGGRQWAPALSIQIEVARDRLGHLDGLLGNAGVPAADEYETRGGERVGAAQLVGFGATDNRILYDVYGASWRITQRDSLFTYSRGKSTRSYTIADFPTQTFDVAKAPAAAAKRAAIDCKAVGVTSAAIRKDCEYDVLATGNPAFAGGDLPLQTVANRKLTTLAPALHPIELGAGTNQPREAYDPSSGDTYVAWLDDSSASIDVCVLTPTARTCNGGAGPYHLVDRLADAGGASPQFF